MSSYPITIPAGLEVNQNIGFNPLAVIVSNYTPYYIYFPDGISFCPPWTSGAIIPISHAQQARASWKQTPFGDQVVGTAPVGVTYTATLTFSDDDTLGISGGTQIANPFNPAKTLTGFLSAGAGVYTVGTIPSGSTIRSIAISAGTPSAPGIIGVLTCRLSDLVSTINLVGVILAAPASAVLVHPYSDPISPVQLSLSVNTWTVFMYVQDVGVPGGYAWFVTVVYN
jgi:hypothetical protein